MLTCQNPLLPLPSFSSP
uniref:Uncharacterized protein n=1 Tax=Rhizophora mucronata TaxID=61149 RepID=A0A2P2NF65_RHIMU